MTPSDDHQKIKELIELGEKATQGEWEQCESEAGIPFVSSSNGGIVLEPIAVRKEIPDAIIQEKDEDFLVAAANSRPALKALLEEVEEYAAAIDSQQEHIETLTARIASLEEALRVIYKRHAIMSATRDKDTALEIEAILPECKDYDAIEIIRESQRAALGDLTSIDGKAVTNKVNEDE